VGGPWRLWEKESLGEKENAPEDGRGDVKRGFRSV
jgi:hypothetical protein